MNLAISRLPPFVTAEGGLSGVVGVPSPSSNGKTGSGRRESKAGSSSSEGLEMAAMAGGGDGDGDGDGFTVTEDTVLHVPKGAKRPTGGLAETLL